MSWSLDTTTYNDANRNTTTTVNVNHTCASGAKLLRLTIFVNGTTARTGGAPTYNSVPMTDSGQGFVFEITVGECGVEVWYLINPSTGASYAVSVPNSGAASINLCIDSYIPSAGGCSFDQSSSNQDTIQNPSLNLTSVASGSLVLGALGSGDRDPPTAGANYTLNATEDVGNQTWGAEYDLSSASGTVAVDFGTARADDWGLIGISFIETSGTPTINTSDSVTTGNTATVSPLVLPDLSLSETSVSTGESTTMELLLADIQPSAESVAVGDTANINALVLEDILRLDSVTLGESQSVQVGAAPVSDNDINVSDSVTASDSATIDALLDVISVQESITLGETSSLFTEEININVSDSASIGETPSVSVTSAPLPDLGINVSENNLFYRTQGVKIHPG